MVQRTHLTGARVVLPEGVVDHGRVTVEGTRIAAVGPAPDATPGQADPAHSHADPAHGQADSAAAHGGRALDLPGGWIVPGFVDLHVHGGGGASFSAGTPEESMTAIRTHRAHGTTTMLASTVTGDLDDLARQAATLSELVEQGELAGIHFEGPFISPTAAAPTSPRCCARPIRRMSASWWTRRAAPRG
ncbi:amidohydrolase family protein [Streptomyces malaysiensis subsp. malaysiensis]